MDPQMDIAMVRTTRCGGPHAQRSSPSDDGTVGNCLTASRVVPRVSVVRRQTDADPRGII
jgi:hypothetical protein